MHCAVISDSTKRDLVLTSVPVASLYSESDAG